jgi:DNA helicase-2/ATP-dependent DNA helicase PcrA
MDTLNETNASKIFLGLNDRQRQAVEAGLGPVLVLAGAGSGKTKVLTHRIAYLIATRQFQAENILALTFTNKAAKEMQSRIDAMLRPGYSQPDNYMSRRQLITSGMPLLGTFHSVCARILRQEIQALGYSRNFVIFDDDDQQKVIRDIISQKNLGTKFSPSLFRNYISQAKNQLQTPENFHLPLDGFMMSTVRDVYAKYQEALFQQNGLDFDDLLMLTAKIFQNSSETLRKYQSLFKYILVDEYQDTNHAQYTLLYMLAVGNDATPGSRNLFVVGDDAQSIYGFRGSNLKNILDFEEHFPDAVVIKLEQNYRSTQNILNAAQGVIALNQNQKRKTLWTENGLGEKIFLVEVEDEVEEAKFVAKHIIDGISGKNSGRGSGGQFNTGRGNAGCGSGSGNRSSGKYKSLNSNEPHYSYEEGDDFADNSNGDFVDSEPSVQAETPKTFSILDHFLKKQKQSGKAPKVIQMYGLPQLPPAAERATGSLNHFAVLYRTHAQSRAVEEVFLQSKIPYQIFGGVKFYQRKEIKDVLAYMRLVLNYRDLVSLTRVINEPARGIGEKSLSTIRDFVLANPLPLGQFRVALKDIDLLPKQFAAAQNFFLFIEELSMFGEEEHLLSLMRLLLKKSGYEKWIRDGSEGGETRWENIEEMFTVAERYQETPWREGLEAFLEEVALMTDIDNAEDAKDVVTMMSLHQAKGLEFETVFLLGLEEGILPHSRSLLSPEELAEEIRLAYVGMTRAKKTLYLLYAQGRRLFGTFQHFMPSRILKGLPEETIEFKRSQDF